MAWLTSCPKQFEPDVLFCIKCGFKKSNFVRDVLGFQGFSHSEILQQFLKAGVSFSTTPKELKYVFTRFMYQIVSSMTPASVLLAMSYANEAKYKQWRQQRFLHSGAITS